MSSPLIWIILPGIVAVLLSFLRIHNRLTVVIATIIVLILAWLAWRLPIDQVILIGPRTLRISGTLSVLGRRFILDNSSRSLLSLLYLIASFWLAGSYFARPGSWFVPAGLGFVVLLVAAFAVDPSFYSALLIEMAALVCIPILSRPGQAPGRGLLRFLTFQTLGSTCMLFAGWAVERVNIDPNNPELTLLTGLLLVLGFALLLAIFPFHTWVPMLTMEAHPYAAAYVIFFLPGVVSILGIHFLQNYAWLRSLPSTYTLLEIVGGLILISSGLLAAFENHLGRVMGYATQVDLGLSLILLGSSAPLATQENPASPLALFFGLFLARSIALGTWAMALSAITENSPGLAFPSIRSLGSRMPFTVGALFLANLSLAAFPLLAGFPLRIKVWELVALTSPTTGILIVIGFAGLVIAALHSLSILVAIPTPSFETRCESRSLQVILVGEMILLVWLGIMPVLP